MRGFCVLVIGWLVGCASPEERHVTAAFPEAAQSRSVVFGLVTDTGPALYAHGPDSEVLEQIQVGPDASARVVLLIFDEPLDVLGLAEGPIEVLPAEEGTALPASDRTFQGALDESDRIAWQEITSGVHELTDVRVRLSDASGSLETARPVMPGLIRGAVDSTSDVDMYTFEMSEQFSLWAKLIDANGGCDLVTWMELYDAEGTELNSEVLGEGGLCTELSPTGTRKKELSSLDPGKYTLAVGGIAWTGSYVLSLRLEMPEL